MGAVRTAALGVLVLAGCHSAGPPKTPQQVIALYGLDEKEAAACMPLAQHASAVEDERDPNENVNWRRVAKAKRELEACRKPIRDAEASAAQAYADAAARADEQRQIEQKRRADELAARRLRAGAAAWNEIASVPEADRLPEETARLEALRPAHDLAQRAADKKRLAEERAAEKKRVAEEKAAVREAERQEKLEAVRERSRGRSQSNPIELSIGDLLSVYSQNEVAGDDLYAHKWVEVTGVLQMVGKDFLGGVYAVLAGYEYETLHCSMNRAQSIVRGLHAGQRIAVRGVVSGMNLRTVVLGDCYVSRYW